MTTRFAHSAAIDPRIVALRDTNLTGFELPGVELELLSLEMTRLDGADLRGAMFRSVDFTGATFRGARLDGAVFRMCRGVGAELAGASCDDTRWIHCEVGASSFRAASLRRATFTSCNLAAATLDDADLGGAMLVASDCHRASLRRTSLDDVESVRTRWADAELSEARDFAYCRELVVEILLRESGVTDLEVVQVLGAVTLMRQACYPIWADLVRGRPHLVELAARVFASYPDSGCREAFELGMHSDPAEAPGRARRVSRASSAPPARAAAP